MNDPKGVGIDKIGGDLSGNVAGRDIHIHADPELQAKVAALEEKIADLQKVRDVLPAEQIEAALAPLQAELALRAQAVTLACYAAARSTMQYAITLLSGCQPCSAVV